MSDEQPRRREMFMGIAELHRPLGDDPGVVAMVRPDRPQPRLVGPEHGHPPESFWTVETLAQHITHQHPEHVWPDWGGLRGWSREELVAKHRELHHPEVGQCVALLHEPGEDCDARCLRPASPHLAGEHYCGCGPAR